MKKLLIPAAAALTLFANAAYADSMNITFGGPSGSPIVVTVKVGDGPVQTTTVTSSAQAIGPIGCNYTWLIVGAEANDAPVPTPGHNNPGCDVIEE